MIKMVLFAAVILFSYFWILVSLAKFLNCICNTLIKTWGIP